MKEGEGTRWPLGKPLLEAKIGPVARGLEMGKGNRDLECVISVSDAEKPGRRGVLIFVRQGVVEGAWCCYGGQESEEG